MAAVHIFSHGLIYALVVNLYLFVMMLTLSPRIWGYQDYPEAVKRKVPVQTKRERTVAAVSSVPWIIFVLAFPVYSTVLLKSKLGGEIPLLIAFVNVFVQMILAWALDMAALDWLIIVRITPRFVIIEGSEASDYKDFSHHFRGHFRAVLVLIPISLVIATLVTYL